MNKKNKRKWIDALRSGKYKQGKGRLKTEDAILLTNKHCCLGVACEIGITNPQNNFSLINNSGLCNPTEFITLDMQYYLSTLNDEGQTFEEIANYIEKNL
jgi:hypothetical protein